MPSPTHIYEPLSSENAALVLVDHQVGLMSGVRDYSADGWNTVSQIIETFKTKKVKAARFTDPEAPPLVPRRAPPSDLYPSWSAAGGVGCSIETGSAEQRH
jgi:nicotinamidase-related amidase